MAIQVPGSIVAPATWDTKEDLRVSPPQAHVRGRTVYVTTPLLAAMNVAWGGLATAVKTATNVETGDVVVVKADPKDPDAVPLRLVGTQNAAEFSFHRPLTKLNLRVPADRQFIISPLTQNIEGLGTAFVFPVAKRVSVPRGRKGAAQSDDDSDGAENPTKEAITQTAAALGSAPGGKQK